MAGGAGRRSAGRHDHQGARRQARAAQRRRHGGGVGARGGRTAASGAGRSVGTRSRRRPRSPRESNGWPTTCSCAARWRRDRRRVEALRATARACCRSAWSASKATSTAATSSPCVARAARRSVAGSATTAVPRRGCIARKPSSEIARLLGFVGESELIHRDNLVLA